MPNNQRSRGWCWTINNPNGWDDANIEQLVESAAYVIYGRENGTEEGTPHYQGYCYFSSLKSFQQVKELIPRAHLERQRGSISQAIDYCKKDGDFQEFGEKPRGGAEQKSKWADVLKLAREGKLQEIEERYPDVYFRYTQKLFSLYRPQRPVILDVLENEWWVGPTGTGKSRTLWTLYPNHFKKALNKWWDNYEGQETVAIEEWSPRNECTASQLKIWADRYPFAAEIKGGTLQNVRPKRIIILSNYSIEECFSNVNDLEPIKRRFKVKHFLSL